MLVTGPGRAWTDWKRKVLMTMLTLWLNTDKNVSCSSSLHADSTVNN